MPQPKLKVGDRVIRLHPSWMTVIEGQEYIISYVSDSGMSCSVEGHESTMNTSRFKLVAAEVAPEEAKLPTAVALPTAFAPGVWVKRIKGMEHPEIGMVKGAVFQIKEVIKNQKGISVHGVPSTWDEDYFEIVAPPIGVAPTAGPVVAAAGADPFAVGCLLVRKTMCSVHAQADGMYEGHVYKIIKHRGSLLVFEGVVDKGGWSRVNFEPYNGVYQPKPAKKRIEYNLPH